MTRRQRLIWRLILSRPGRWAHEHVFGRNGQHGRCAMCRWAWVNLELANR